MSVASKAFEYRVEEFRLPPFKRPDKVHFSEEDEALVAQLGKEGWELTGVIPTTGGLGAYIGAVTFWKREITTS